MHMQHPVIHIKKPSSDNIKRILLLYNDSAAGFLQRRSNIHENIHQARLCFKRIRSLLRLGRVVLGEHIYKDLNTLYRDQSRMLSQFRDITALIEISQSFQESRRSESTRSFLTRFRNGLLKQRKELMAGIEIENAKKQVVDLLVQKKQILDELYLNDHPASDLSKGLKRVYKSGKNLYQITLKKPTDHHMHEWRKQVKYMWYQLVMLTPLWPVIFNALSKQAQTLSQLLGKHHDLVLFENALVPMKNKIKYRNEIQVLERSIRRNKRNLESQAFKLGVKIYLVSPNQMEKMINGLFTATRTD
jgi:CHAD domain-containing protein